MSEFLQQAAKEKQLREEAENKASEIEVIMFSIYGLRFTVYSLGRRVYGLRCVICGVRFSVSAHLTAHLDL